MNVAFFQELLNSVAERGRAILPRALFGHSADEDIYELSRALLSGRGEASGVAIAREVLLRYAELTADERRKFFGYLASELNPDPARVAVAAQRYLEMPGEATLGELQAASEAPRQEFFRRLNLAPGATGAIVALRNDLHAELRANPALKVVDVDLRHLLQSWFNRGFLVLRGIDWQTPAAILEKIIRYEAVHAIESWEDLRRRLDPADRRCFAFFHPSLVDEPLIFVEVALTGEVPSAIAPLLAASDQPSLDEEPTTAAFYSISNCQPGLKGISFGNFLLKQVVEELAREKPSLKTFVTLSPMPGFARWLDALSPKQREELLDFEDWAAVNAYRSATTRSESDEARAALLSLGATYLTSAKAADGKPLDSVARFHIGNGATLARVNWMADTSDKGLSESLGLMVNYRYDLDDIETNHEAFASEGTVATGRAVKALIKAPPKAKSLGKPVLALPLPLGKRAG